MTEAIRPYETKDMRNDPDNMMMRCPVCKTWLVHITYLDDDRDYDNDFRTNWVRCRQCEQKTFADMFGNLSEPGIREGGN